MKTFKYLLKQTIIIFVYLIITMITSFAITAIENMDWLRITLWLLNLGLFGFIVFVMIMKTGEDGAKLKHTNDIKRRVIMKTGDYYEFNLAGEEGKFKGLYIGLIVCAPLVLLALLELIFIICGITQSVTSAIAVILYGTFCMPLRGLFQNCSIFFFLYTVPVICAITHFGYTFGVLKMKKQYAKIAKTNEAIYGKRK